MLSYIKDFFSRHKRKIIIIGVVIGGTFVASRYGKKKFIEWQEREANEFLERTKKQQYFDSTEKTCNQTIICLATKLRENIINLVKCEDIIQKLKEGASNKVELWSELKVLVFTKVSLLIYAGTLLVIALRIQLNIIGGHIYCNTISSKSDGNITSSLQEKYLAQCHYFLDTGIAELCALVKEKVELALKDVTLKQSMTLQHIENIFWAIQSSINNDPRNPLKMMPQVLYGKVVQEDNSLIKDMMMDTIDLLQSAEVYGIATSGVSRGFSNAVDKISECFLPEINNIVAHSSTSREVGNAKLSHSNNFTRPFAKIIPLINGYDNQSECDSSWISPFIYMDRVKMLGANIYESYSCTKVYG